MTHAHATARNISNVVANNIKLGTSMHLSLSARTRYRHWRHTVASHINRMIDSHERFTPLDVIRRYNGTGSKTRKLIHEYREGNSALAVAASLVNFYRWKYH